MSEPLFRSLDSAVMANDIRTAQQSVCYAAPGIQQAPASAMTEVAKRIGPELVTVCLDFDERVMRMGFGDLAAVKTLRDAGIVVRSTPGLRTGLVIVDNSGYIFTPTALYLEADQRESDAPNALRLTRDQVMEALARLNPAAKAIAMAQAKTPEERERIREQSVEVPSVEVADNKFAAVEQRLNEAPPVPFDVGAKSVSSSPTCNMSSYACPALLSSVTALLSRGVFKTLEVTKACSHVSRPRST